MLQQENAQLKYEIECLRKRLAAKENDYDHSDASWAMQKWADAAKKVKVVNILSYGGACPFQIDALTDDNRLIYGRYRWGHLTATIGAQDDLSEDAAIRKELIFSAQVGGEYDGCMDLNEFQEHTKDAIDWSDAVDEKEIWLKEFLAKS